MQIIKGREAKSLETIAQAASNWRVLNLFRTTRALDHAHGPGRKRFFKSRRLNKAIIVKHTLRESEQSLFDKAPVVATKLLLPLDESSLSCGAISLFVGEKGYAQVMRESAGIAVGPDGQAGDADALVLNQINNLASLDTFLLRERFSAEEFGVSSDYFQIGLTDDAQLRSFIIREVEPLIRIAAPQAGKEGVARFVDALFGSAPKPEANDFFEAAGIPQKLRNEIIFAWKAALFYEQKFRASEGDTASLIQQLSRLTTYGHSDAYPRSYVEAVREVLTGAMQSGLNAAQTRLSCFDATRRKTVIESASPQALRAYLDELPGAVAGFGAQNALLAHALSFWRFRTETLDPGFLPAEAFCQIASAITGLEAQFGVTQTLLPAPQAAA